MSTADEIETRIANAQCHLTKRIDALNDRIMEMQTRMNETMTYNQLISEMQSGTKVDHYEWTHEYSFQPGRRCDLSEKLIIPGTKAYKGKFAVGKETIHTILTPSAIYPAELWLTKEEFTVRRLKGQI